MSINDENVRAFVARAYPAVDRLPGNDAMERRCWFVRTTRSIVPDDASRLQGRIVAEIQDGLTAKFSSEDIARFKLGLVITVIDGAHLAVEAISLSRSSGSNVGDVDMILSWGALQRLDAQIGIEDLQGLPRGMWKPLLWASSADPDVDRNVRG